MYVYAAAGFALLFGGGEFLVRGAVVISRRLGLPSLLVGMTVVAWCTSAPELVVSLGAALDGKSDLAVGNVVGSNVFNVLGVLGVAALIAPIAIDRLELRRDTTVMVAAALAISFVTLTGEIGRLAGLVLFAAMLGYVVLSYRSEKRRPDLPSATLHEHEAAEVRATGTTLAGTLLLAGGLGALVIGSRLLIVGATEIARAFGVSEAVIGLTLVAVGTSLPELATSIIAALRRHPDVAVGNVVGSNIFNVLGILGITAIVQPIGVANRIASFDAWVMLGVSVLLVPMLLVRGRIGRIGGVGLVALYAGYLSFLL